MQEHGTTPASWLQSALNGLQWPAICIFIFWLGSYVERLKTRVTSAEVNLKALIERHLPHVHRALAEIKGKLDTLQALMQKGK
jgi:hypothetical protein